MLDTVVRVASVKIKNIKNVREGLITLPNMLKKKMSTNNAEVLGIYGQNGSGKTAVIDTFFYLQRIMNGNDIDESIADYIDASSDKAEINVDFNIFADSILYEVGYHIWLKKYDNKVIIERENLSCARNDDEGRSNKTVFIDYHRDESEYIFKPQKRVEELISINRELKTDLIVARKMAEKSNCSYIFGESSREIFCRSYDNGFAQYAFIINALYNFALKDLFVIRNSHSGVISANVLLPVAFRFEDEDMGIKGDFAIPLTKPVLLKEKRKKLLEIIVEQINTVLCTIIPGLGISIRDYGKQALDTGEEGWKVELMSRRPNRPEIPIRMESEGIIKIISILNALIQAFANSSICLVIDELDAGIFEYMLGELLEIFSKSAKGQLIFTSHNLRALEMLDKESIVFSTANPDNRYIHMKNVRESNNLRNMYIRSITLGGQDEVIYDETDSIKIARAFRKAGRGIRNE